MDDGAVIKQWLEQIQRPEVFDDLTSRINVAIAAQVPAFEADPGLALDLAENTRGQVEAFVSFVRGQPVETPWGALALARSFARRGLELEQFLRVYRIGLSSAQQYLAGSIVPADGVPALPAAVAVQLITMAGEWMDNAVERLSTAYVEERRRWLGGELTRRAEMVHEILRGDHDDVERASAALGYPLQLEQTALTLWSATERVEAGAFDSVAQQLRSTLGAVASLTVPASERAAWLWLAGPLPERAALAASVVRVLESADLRAAVGIGAAALTGFRRSHEEALAAHRLSARAGRSDRLTSYAELELVSLLSADETRMRVFMARTLGGLAGDDDNSARLRETLLAALLHGLVGAAGALNVHKNTVRYRVTQAETLLARPTTDNATEVILALRCASYFGIGAVKGADR